MGDNNLYFYLGVGAVILILLGVVFYTLPRGEDVHAPPQHFQF